MSLVEEVQKIVDEKYSDLCIKVRADELRLNGGAWIFMDMGTSGCVPNVRAVDTIVRACLEELKYLVECSLEKMYAKR